METDMVNVFWFGYKLKDFLLPGFDVDSYMGFVAVCCGTAMLVLIFECLKTNRVIKKMKSTISVGAPSLFKLAFSRSTERSNLIERQETGRCRQYREIWRISDILGHFFEVGVGYLLMMIAMTFNVYLMISMCVGALIGYLFYGSVMFNIAAQLVCQRVMCIGCEIKTEGDLAPIIEHETENEFGASTSTTDHNCENSENESFTTAQIHHNS